MRGAPSSESVGLSCQECADEQHRFADRHSTLAGLVDLERTGIF